MRKGAEEMLQVTGHQLEGRRPLLLRSRSFSSQSGRESSGSPQRSPTMPPGMESAMRCKLDNLSRSTYCFKSTRILKHLWCTRLE